MIAASALLFALLPLTAPNDPVITPPVESSTAESLERGLASIDANKIKSDLYFIASDEMKGRDTVTPEQRIAARFIRARLQRLGFQPGNGEKYLYEFPLENRSLDLDSLQASVQGDGEAMALTYGRDYVFTDRFGVDDMENSGEVLYVGAGKMEDFDLKGKWALVLRKGHSFRGLREKARSGEALGLLVMPIVDEDLIAHYQPRSESTFEGRVAWPGQSSRWGTPVASCALSAEAATALVGDDTLSEGAILSNSFMEKRSLKAGSEIVAENVIGIWPGSDPELSNEVLIVSAHYDHVGVRGGEVYNGADDNGSGTTGLMALAESLVEYGPMRRSVMLIWVSGEEKGLWGSKAWASNPSLPEGMHAIANLNIDMIGRKAPNELYVTPSSKHKGYNELTRSVERYAKIEGFGGFPEGREQGFEGLGSADVYYTRSDHAEFAKLGIPVCFLFAGEHEDYHQATDTAEKIDYDKIARVTRVVLRMLDSLQADKLNL